MNNFKTICIFSIILCIFNAQTKKTQYNLIPLTQQYGGKCLDGSAPSIYVKDSKHNPDPKKFIIFFMGGGWCDDDTKEKVLKNCFKKTKQFKGSIIYNEPEVYSFTGILSHDPKINPYLYDYTVVYINYCDQAGHQGYSLNPIQVNNQDQFWFRGTNNTLTALKYAKEQMMMTNAETVLVSGNSAGGLSALTWIDYISNDLKSINSKIQVLGIPESGFFLDYPSYLSKMNKYKYRMINLLEISNQDSNYYVNQNCIQSNKQEPYKCMFAEHLIYHIETPLLIINSGYDSWQTQRILEVDCNNDKQNYQALRICKKQQRQYIQLYHEKFISTIEAVQKQRSNISSWIISCPVHDIIASQPFNNLHWTIPFNSENSVANIIDQFIQNQNQGSYKQVQYNDKVKWPYNLGCSSGSSSQAAQNISLKDLQSIVDKNQN